MERWGTEDKQVVELLKRAISAVDASSAPEELREAALTVSVGLLSGGVAPQPNSTGAAPAIPHPPAGGGTSGSDLPDRIANGLAIDPSKVAKVFKDHDGLPELIIKTNKLPVTKSQATVDIAYLVMGARQAAGIEESTEAEVLRSASKQYGKFDSSNFSSHLKALDGSVQSSGKGGSMLRKLTKPGIETASELVEKYAGEA